MKCDNGTKELCSTVNIFYEFKSIGKEYLVKYKEEYSDYGIFDVLSGVGGIFGTTQGSFDTFFSLLLMGFGCACINWKGIAPYPNFDNNFTERILKLMEN